MAVILNMHKAVRKIKLDDSEGSPEFVLDLTDQAMQDNAVKFAGCAAVYGKITEDIDRDGLTEEIKERLIACYHVTIDAFLGDGAFDTICAWLTDDEGVPAEAMTAAFAPLMVYLYDEYHSVLTANRNMAVSRYIDGLRHEAQPL